MIGKDLADALRESSMGMMEVSDKYIKLALAERDKWREAAYDMAEYLTKHAQGIADEELSDLLKSMAKYRAALTSKLG